jgi:probable F420-dependent oxidoreductase
MRFGLLPPVEDRFLSSPERVTAYARAAEDAGFESIWVFEHAVIPAGYTSRYPYNPEGRLTIEDEDIPDPLTLLAYLAGTTRRLLLGTGVLLLPQRSPVVCAKECATVDALSGGRLRLGVGVGWLREEAEAVGTTFGDRGARTDEYIEAMRVLWSEPEATFRGTYTRFERAKCNPKPVQRGGVPILVGGHSAAAARRAGRLGDGFFPIGLRPDAFSARVAEMRAAALAAGRDPDAIEISYNGGTRPDRVRQYAELGVSRWVVAVWETDPDAYRRTFDELAATLIEPLADSGSTLSGSR